MDTHDARRLGATVYLNSGSPPLTVWRLEGDDVTVRWDGPDGPASMTAPAVCFCDAPRAFAESFAPSAYACEPSPVRR